MDRDSSDGVSTVRLYGAAIAVVSGLYSGYLAVTGMAMSLGAWFMLGLGAVVLVHGIVLVTPAAGRLGTASGPLMLAYAALMLLNQLRLAAGVGAAGGADGMDGMDGSMGGMAATNDGGMGSAMASMGADAGMVAIAALMLASGLIMTVRADMMDASG